MPATDEPPPPDPPANSTSGHASTPHAAPARPGVAPPIGQAPPPPAILKQLPPDAPLPQPMPRPAPPVAPAAHPTAPLAPTARDGSAPSAPTSPMPQSPQAPSAQAPPTAVVVPAQEPPPAVPPPAAVTAAPPAAPAHAPPALASDSGTTSPPDAPKRHRRTPIGRYDLIALGVILVVAAVLRWVNLDTFPATALGDTTDNTQNALQVIEGTGPGIFGFDWKPGPIFGIYPMAWIMGVFGDSLWAARSFAAVGGVVTVALTYLLARRSMGPIGAVPATLLLATNLAFLHFSRSGWENIINAMLAIGACYTTQRALDSERARSRNGWWIVTSLAITLGLYGYFTGRLIAIAVAIIMVGALSPVTFAGGAFARRRVDYRGLIPGMLLTGGLAAVLFAPMALEILDNWDFFNRRSETVSILSIPEGEAYEGNTGRWAILRDNFARNVRGFIFHDGSTFNRGLWNRYNPDGAAPLGPFVRLLFFGGLVVGAVHWRRTWTWWPFFVPLFIAEVFSRATPDLARGIMIVPFYFLFVGLALEWLVAQLPKLHLRQAAAAGLIALAMVVSVVNVRSYVEWQRDDGVQVARLPGVHRCEWEMWMDMARDAAKQGVLLDAAAFDVARRELACSDLVNDWLGPPAE